MMHKLVQTILAVTCIVMAVFCPAVLASDTVDGQENIVVIHRGIVYQGTESVQVKGFGADTDSFIHESGLADLLIIEEGSKVRLEKDQATGIYWAYNTTNDLTFDKYFSVSEPEKIDTTIALSTMAALRGDTITVTITGTPNKQYTVSVSGLGENSPMFSNGAKKKTFTMPSSGEKMLQLFIPDTCDQGRYTVSVIDDKGKKDIDFSVSTTVTTIKLTFEYVSDDVRNGLFAVGDTILLTGNLEPQPTDDYNEPFYLFITGYGLPENGVNLQGTPVVDGDGDTFTVVEYDNDKKLWEYYWYDTNNFNPGTYTLHISFEPIGFSKSSSPGGVGSASQEISLSKKSIHVKFAEENNGIFTQGDYLYAYWSARGSPDKVRWYIIGQNYMRTGVTDYLPHLTPTQELGIDAPQGLFGFTYDRSVSNSMAAGNYYLLYQHPGDNNKFDVNPNIENGFFTSLTSTFGDSVSLERRPSSNCAMVLQELVNDIKSDDLCVISEITIESPSITIDQVDHIEIGDSLKIKGTTNYAGYGNTADGIEVESYLSLRIDRLNFDITEENSAMKLQIVNRVVPQNIIPYSGERTYEFDEIDTATWFAGTYQATVTNIYTGFSKSIMFTVGGEGTEADSSTLQVPADPLEEPVEELEPLPPIERYEEPTEPEEPKSPGFILAPLALAAAFILRRK